MNYDPMSRQPQILKGFGVKEGSVVQHNLMTHEIVQAKERLIKSYGDGKNDLFSSVVRETTEVPAASEAIFRLNVRYDPRLKDMKLNEKNICTSFNGLPPFADITFLGVASIDFLERPDSIKMGYQINGRTDIMLKVPKALVQGQTVYLGDPRLIKERLPGVPHGSDKQKIYGTLVACSVNIHTVESDFLGQIHAVRNRPILFDSSLHSIPRLVQEFVSDDVFFGNQIESPLYLALSFMYFRQILLNLLELHTDVIDSKGVKSDMDTRFHDYVEHAADGKPVDLAAATNETYDMLSDAYSSIIASTTVLLKNYAEKLYFPGLNAPNIGILKQSKMKNKRQVPALLVLLEFAQRECFGFYRKFLQNRRIGTIMEHLPEDAYHDGPSNPHVFLSP